MKNTWKSEKRRYGAQRHWKEKKKTRKKSKLDKGNRGKGRGGKELNRLRAAGNGARNILIIIAHEKEKQMADRMKKNIVAEDAEIRRRT